MNEIFRIYSLMMISHPNRERLRELLLSFLSGKPASSNMHDVLLFNDLQTNGIIDPVKIFQLIGLMHQKTKESEKIANTDKRKHFGIYYTDYDIARLIAKEALNDIRRNDLLELRFYEPCAGGGIFIVAFIDEVFARIPQSAGSLQKLMNNIYFSDVDDDAINMLLKLLPLYIKSKYGANIKIRNENYFSGNALLKKDSQKIFKVHPKDILNVKDGFDIVLTNPPYKLLKANSDKYQDENNENRHALDIKEVVSFIRNNKIYKYNQGTLNYYRIFLEEILENYTKPDGKIGVIVPATLLNDKQSELLRKRIVNCYKLSKLYIIPEKNDFFPDISQAFCFFALDKKEHGGVIEINTEVINKNDFPNDGVKIEIEQFKQLGSHAPIVAENYTGWQILKKMNRAPKLHSLISIHNARGELDLTLDKAFISEQDTFLPLLRGNNIDEFSYTLGEYFVTADFVKRVSAKGKYVLKERIVCQQVSNIHLEKRLKFVRIPSNIVLGNSCNFLAFNQSLFDGDSVSLDYLLGILNSFLLNWRFKATNSNNHISNYELAELPIVVPAQQEREKIENLVRLIEANKHPDLLHRLNEAVFDLYELSEEEKDYILERHCKTIGKEQNAILQNSNLFDHANI